MLAAYRWFVIVTGAVNLLGGPILVWLSSSPLIGALGTKAFIFTTAGFLSFSGAALIWAAQRPEERGLIIFWEGVLRLWAAATFFLASDWPNAPLVTFGDGSIGLIYIVGLLALVRAPLITKIFGAAATMPVL